LYDSPYTGAVTTRSCTLDGFAHDKTIHQYTFFNPETLNSSSDPNASEKNTGSLNTLGYSPISLPKLVDLLVGFSDELRERHADPSNTKVARKDKPFIISITGTPDELKQCYHTIKPKFLQLAQEFPIYIEINLSCPNISGTSFPSSIIKSF
jgi:dihydroorotate dehydrogenase (fumarate)